MTGALHFTDSSGKTFLSEIAGTRRLDPATDTGRSDLCSGAGVCLPAWRTSVRNGEFQDGFLDIRDLPRRLTQVNSQIAIPFLLSSKGYGILWHNYGLTDLNPADERVVLTRTSTGNETTANVTTSRRRETGNPARGRICRSLEIPAMDDMPSCWMWGKRWPAGTMLRSTESRHRLCQLLASSHHELVWRSLRGPPQRPRYRRRRMTSRFCFGGRRRPHSFAVSCGRRGRLCCLRRADSR